MFHRSAAAPQKIEVKGLYLATIPNYCLKAKRAGTFLHFQNPSIELVFPRRAGGTPFQSQRETALRIELVRRHFFISNAIVFIGNF